MKTWLRSIALLCFLLFITSNLKARIGDDRIDVNDGIAGGIIVVRLKPFFDIGSIADVFDDNPNTLARTAKINPARIILEFKTEFNLHKSRLLMSSGDGEWSLETAETLSDLENKTDSYRLIFENRPLQMDVWDEAEFSTTGKFIQLTARRTTGDNYVHLNEWELYGELQPLPISSLRAELDSLQLYEGWRWKHTKLFATTADSVEIEVSKSKALWSSSDSTVASVDTSGTIFTHNAGVATITATYQEQQAHVQVTVLAAVYPPVFEQIDSSLATPAPHHLYEIPVVVFRFLPTKDGINLDVSYAPDFRWLHEITLQEMIEQIDANDRMVKFMLEERSRFRGYKDSTAVPSLGYKVVAYITVYEQAPPGDIFRYQNGYPIFWPDYHLIFERFNMEHYVNDLGVKEIWMWINQLDPGQPSYDPAIHRPENFRSIWESNMASPTTGDISNSNRNNEDLPIYNTTYVVYDRNMRRYPTTLHVYGHQLEAMLSYVNQLQDGNTHLFWKKFVGQDDYGNFITGRCGWTHMPPNTTENYDYFNPTLVESDIEDWTPDRVGETKLVNADTWGNLDYAYPEDILDDRAQTEANWYIYWMQNMPGYGNTIENGDNYMTNWWVFTAKWDSVIQANMGLYAPKPAKLELVSDSLATGIYKNAYRDTVVVTGGTPPYRMWINLGCLPAGLALDPATQTIAGLPTESGTFQFELKVEDHGMPVQADSVRLSLTIVNHPPRLLSSDSVAVVEGQVLSYTARADDPDGNDILYGFEHTPVWLNAADSTLSGMTPKGAADTSFVVTATDGELSDTLSVTVTVLASNRPPHIVNLSDFSFVNDEVYTIQLDSCVVDSNHSPAEMVWSITVTDSSLHVSVQQHTAYFSANHWAGAADVLFKVTDPEGATDSLVVVATVKFPTGIDHAQFEIPETFVLEQNYPNPFNHQTTIVFGLPKAQDVTLAVYNLLGLKVSDVFKGKATAGFHRVIWDAKEQSSGVYFIVFKTGAHTLIKRSLLLK